MCERRFSILRHLTENVEAVQGVCDTIDRVFAFGDHAGVRDVERGGQEVDPIRTGSVRRGLVRLYVLPFLRIPSCASQEADSCAVGTPRERTGAVVVSASPTFL